MVKTHFHVTILAYARPRTKVQVPRETKPSTLESILTFYSSTYATLACNRGINLDTTERVKSQKDGEDDHKKQIEKWDDEYKHVYPCKGLCEGEDHLNGLGE